MLRGQVTSAFKRLLEKRGITDAAGFLNPSIRDFPPVSELQGVDRAAEALFAFISSGGKIVVFGDYDCDGVCATALTVRALRSLGCRAEPFLPSREKEGYGMSDASVARMLGEHPDVKLVLTVDNGIGSCRQVSFLRGKGVEVIVTDHHLAGAEMPQCIVVNPVLDPAGVFAPLCGAAVAFTVIYRLAELARSKGVYSGGKMSAPLLVLAGLATVTDIMPLTGCNRILVAESLRWFDSCAPQGLKSLMNQARGDGVPSGLTSRDYGFVLGPRINAAGRMDEAGIALKLLLEDDCSETRVLACKVDALNTERKKIEQKMVDKALELVEEDSPAQVIEVPDGHPGVAGIVASRILERLERKVPVCVIAGGRGSARSPEGLNIRDAFEACADCLENFGGHAAAGGFSVKPGRTGDFRRALCAYVEGNFIPVQKEQAYDIDVALHEVTGELYDDVRRLEPFGEGNEVPVFLLKGVRVSDPAYLGADGKHLVFRVGGKRAVWWNQGGKLDFLSALASDVRTADVYFTIEMPRYCFSHDVELKVRDVVETTGC